MFKCVWILQNKPLIYLIFTNLSPAVTPLILTTKIKEYKEFSFVDNYKINSVMIDDIRKLVGRTRDSLSHQ